MTMFKIDQEFKRNARALSMLGQSGAILGSELISLAGLGDDDYFLTTADYGNPAGASRFQTLYPKNFINCGIAEQNMIGVAAGLASTGSVSLAVAQACFLTMRSFEPIRQYCGYMQLPIILIGVSSGFALQFFGNSHYALEDIALMRLMPNMQIYTPSDAISAIHCFHMAVASQKPSYIRCTGEGRLPVIYNSLHELSGAFCKHFMGSTVAVVSSGAITSNALKAVRDANLSSTITLFDIFDCRGLDDEFLEELANFKKIIVLEEHDSNSGIGDLLRKRLSALSISVEQPKVPVYGHSVGTREHLLKQYGLHTEGIANFITRFV